MIPRPRFLSALALSAIFVPGGAAAEESATFNRDIAPIFQTKCQSCHRPGQIGPMPLVTYEETRPWARAIRQQAAERLMPPFHGDGPPGYFIDDPRLTEAEIARIVRWVESGAPEGSPADLPPAREWSEGWPLGEPDQILRMAKPYRVLPREKDRYELFIFDAEFPRTAWVAAIDIRPSDPSLVHHAVLHLVEPGVTADEGGRVEAESDVMASRVLGRFLLGWSPGATPLKNPPGAASYIPKGARLGIQIHFAPVEEPREEQTEVGLYLADGFVTRTVRTLEITPREALPALAPGEAERAIETSAIMPEEGEILSMIAHMHLRGKSFRFSLAPPGGEKRVILDIPRYQFDWQRTYELARPIRAEKGAEIECRAVFDNSAANPANPDPGATVEWGFLTSDEMNFGGVNYLPARRETFVLAWNGRSILPALLAAALALAAAAAGAWVAVRRLRARGPIASRIE